MMVEELPFFDEIFIHDGAFSILQGPDEVMETVLLALSSSEYEKDSGVESNSYFSCTKVITLFSPEIVL